MLDEKYAYYHIPASKVKEFKAEAEKLFTNPELKKELQKRMYNLNKDTKEFDLFVARNANNKEKCSPEILALGKKYGKGHTEYAPYKNIGVTTGKRYWY